MGHVYQGNGSSLVFFSYAAFLGIREDYKGQRQNPMLLKFAKLSFSYTVLIFVHIFIVFANVLSNISLLTNYYINTLTAKVYQKNKTNLPPVCSLSGALLVGKLIYCWPLIISTPDV